MVKNLSAMRETWFGSLGWEDPLEEGMATHFEYPCLENSHGKRSLADCSPRGRKESDMTERQNTHTVVQLQMSSSHFLN